MAKAAGLMACGFDHFALPQTQSSHTQPWVLPDVKGTPPLLSLCFQQFGGGLDELGAERVEEVL
jgi:hypothetical protein